MEQINFWKPYQGAVSLTFDDGTRNQLQMAVPLLNECNLKGTFYIIPTEQLLQNDFVAWQAVAAQGHELGNHSLQHLCASNFLRKPGGLEERTLAEIEQDILTAQARLTPLAPHQTEWTFAYPCYGTDVGRGLQRQSYIPLIAQHFLAGRVRGEYGFGNDPHVMDLAAVWGIPTERMSGFELIGLVEQLTAEGLWVILVFHEINGSRLTVGSYDLRLLCQFLQRRQSEIWTAPVQVIARRIRQLQRGLSDQE
ncbi:polysaccharide deacetylase family protein [candidate division KSB1 bacterium]|nr:polysaccharide deacetylase family protein [candidate division KSB1 bacterium]